MTSPNEILQCPECGIYLISTPDQWMERFQKHSANDHGVTIDEETAAKLIAKARKDADK